MITIRLGGEERGSFLGSRFTAKHLREEIERALRSGEQVALDFTGIKSVTDSFVDELLGALIATADRDVLPLLIFKGCTPSVRTAIETLLHEVTARRGGG